MFSGQQEKNEQLCRHTRLRKKTIVTELWLKAKPEDLGVKKLEQK